MTKRAQNLLLTVALLLGVTGPAAAAGTSYSIGYGGRVTSATGAPVASPVDLKVSFFRTATGGEPIVPTVLDFPATPLTQGVFQITMTLPAAEFAAVFSEVSQPVFIQVTDGTHSVTYPRQQFLMVPYAAKVPVDGSTITYDTAGQLTLTNPPGTTANSLVQLDSASRLPALDGSQLTGVMATGFTGKLGGDVSGGQASTTVTKIQGQPVAAIGATSGQVLTWTGGQWAPATPAAGSGGPISGPVNLGQAGAVTGTLAVAYGGTGSGTTLNNNSLMISSGGAIVEAPALSNGQFFIGSAGTAPVAATLSQGTTQGVTVTTGAGSLTLDTVQDIRTSATPLFSGLTLANPAAGSLVKVGAGGTLVAAAPADLKATLGYTPVNKAGDGMTGNLGIGTTSATTTLDIAGAFTERGSAPPGVAPAGQGRLYFDSTANQFMVSQNGGAYAPLLSGGTITGVTAGTGMTGGGTAGNVTVGLTSVGTAGTYTKVLTDANGRVTSGTSLASADLPLISANLLTSGTLQASVIPALDASQITTGTFAPAQIPTLPPSQISGTLALAQIPALPASQITSGTLAVAQIPALPASQITSGTLAIAQIPALPAAQITGTLTTAQLPSLSLGEVTSGTLAVSLGGTGATSFASNGIVVGGGNGPLSTIAAGAAYNVLTVNASNQPVFGALNLGSGAAVSGTLPVASGGTGSGSTLTNNRLMLSAGGAIVEAPALGNGQLFIGSAGNAPAAATLTQGGTQGVTFTTGAGSLTLDTVQDIRTSATPLFSGLTLSSPLVGSVVKVGTGGTLAAAAASDLTTALGYTPVNKAGDTMGGSLSLGGFDLTGAGNIDMAPSKTLAMGTFTTDPSGLTTSDVGKTWFNTTSNQLKYWDGSTSQALGVSGAGLTSLNGQSGSTQTFGVPGITGLSPTWTSGSNTHTLDIPLASAASVTAGLLSNADYQTFTGKVNKSGDTMTGSLGIGTTSAETTLDIAGALTERAVSQPAVAPTGQGRLYFDSTANQFMVSQNGGGYTVLASGGTITGVTSGTGLSGGGTSGNVSLALTSVGTSGTYTKVVTDANGRVTNGTTLTAADIPPLSAATITSGTLSTAQIPSLPATQINSGTFAIAQIPPIPAATGLSGTLSTAQIPPIPAATGLSGTLSTAQIPSLPATQINSGTFAIAQIPPIPAATGLSGTLTVAQLPPLPATDITGTLTPAQLPSLSSGEINTGTLAVAFGGTGTTSFTNNGILVGGGSSPLSTTAAGNQYNILTVNASNQPVFGQLNLGQGTAVTGTLPVANGGTGSSAALGNNRLMLSSGGTIVEAPALTSGQIFIGSTGVAPAAATLAQGATQGVTVTAGAGSLTLDTAQDIRTSATPLFSSLKLTNPGVGSLVKVGTGSTLVAAAAADLTSTLGYTPVNKAGDTMTGPLSHGGFDLINVGNIDMAASKTLAMGTFTTDPSGLTTSDVGKTWFNTTSNQLKYWDGSTAQALGVSGAGLTSLNGQSGSTQTFGVPGITGLSPTWTSGSNTHTLDIPLASAASVTAGLLSNADYQTFTGKVNKSGDTMTGSLGIGTTSAETTLDIAGALTERAISPPAVAPTGQGRLYFDSTANQFMVSQNGGGYTVLASGGTITGVTSGTGLSGGGTSGSVSLALTNIGTPGTYTKVVTDANGRVTNGTTLAATDLPPHSAALITSGTLSTAQIPSLPATQINSGTFAIAQIPPIPAATGLSGTLSTAQIPSLPATQINSGTFAIAQIPPIPAATGLSGTLTVAQIPPLPAADITGTLAPAQLPSLSGGEINTGTLAVAFGGTGATSFTNNGLVVGGGSSPLSTTAAGNQYNILTVNASNQPVFGQLNLGQGAAVTGTLPVASGGTGSGAALGNNRLMLSSGGTIVEAPALTSGQIFIGSTGVAPAAATLAQGATQGVTVTAGAGSLTLDTAQDIRTSATPLFSSLKLTNPSVGSLVKVGSGGTLVAAAAADLTTTLGYTPVNKAGDQVTGNLTTTGTVGIGTTSAETALDVAGAFTERAITAPAVAPVGQGRLYFDTTANQFMVSQNGGAYAALGIGGTISGVNAGTGLSGGGTSGSVTLTLTSVGAPGTYTKVITDAYGRVTSGTTLAATDIPPLSAATIASGTLSAAQLPSIGTPGTYPKVVTDAYGRVTSGSALAATDLPAFSAALVTSGTLAVSVGGTGSTTALSNNRLMWSSGGAIVEAPALTNGQLFIGSTGAAPAATTLAQGATQGVTFTAGAGSLTLDTAQDIRTSATPLFSSLKLTNPSVGSIVKVGTGSTLVAAAAADLTSTLGYTPVNKAGDTMTGTLNLPANGLTVGTSQLTVSGSNVGIGTTSAIAGLQVGSYASVSSPATVFVGQALSTAGNANYIGNWNNSGTWGIGPATNSTTDNTVRIGNVASDTTGTWAGTQNLSLVVGGNVGIGTTSAETALDVAGALTERAIAAPAVAPTGQGRIYFDSTLNQFMLSQNGGAYAALSSGGGITSVTAGAGLSGGGSSGSVTLSLPNVGAAGTYTKVTTDVYGRVTNATTLAASDIPSLPPTQISGTLAIAQIPSLPAGQITSGTLATALIPAHSAALITSGTLANAQLPAIPSFTKLVLSNPAVNSLLSVGTGGTLVAAAASNVTSALGYTPVSRAGDTMTGVLNLAANGLTVGGNQIVASGGYVGVGSATPVEVLDVSGGVHLGASAGTNAGTLQWNGTYFQGYNGTSWVNLSQASTSNCDNTVTYSTPGTFGYTVPSSYATIVVKMWGGGGGGGGGNSNGAAGGGGGGTTTIASRGLSATGGAGGAAGNAAFGSGGSGGTASGGDTNTSGNTGGTGSGSTSGAGANSPAAGGAGGSGVTGANGNAGSTGGGGSGGEITGPPSGGGGGGSGAFVQKTYTPTTLNTGTLISDIVVGAGGTAGGGSGGSNGGAGGAGYVSITCSTTGTPPANNNAVVYLNGGQYTTSSSFVYTSGYVGIGTTSPGKKLEVSQSVAAGSAIDATLALRILNTDSSGTGSNSDVVGIGFGNNSTRQAIVGGTYGYDFLDFYTAGNLTTPRMRLDPYGNVGIGTTSPYFALDVNEGSATDGGIRIFGTGTSADGDMGLRINNIGTGGVEWYLDSTNNSSGYGGGKLAFVRTPGTQPIMTLTNGSLGIGTTAPQAGLDISTTGTLASAIIVPRDTDANRPSTPVSGMLRYSTTDSNLESYQGTTASWNTMQGTVARVDLTGQTGAIGFTTMFTPTTSDFFTLCSYANVTTTGSSGNLSIGMGFASEAGATTGNTGVSFSITSPGNWQATCVPFYAVAGTAIQYKTSLSGSAGSLQYTLHLRLTNMH